jgi:hypothetical protein
MNKKIVRMIALTIFAQIAVLGSMWQARAEDTKTPYTKMAPLDQYLMERNAEIELARSAAPESISKDAGVMVLGRRGYETAVKGTNGFVCIVERGWTAGVDDPDFWNPKLRGPLCLNAAAVRSYLPLTIKKTEWVLAGQSKDQMFDSLKAAFEKKELPTPETGSMCYMLSKQGYLADANGHWHPHLMFFLPLSSNPEAWGASLPGSPVLGFRIAEDNLTLFLVPVGKWSDGTVDSPM